MNLFETEEGLKLVREASANMQDLSDQMHKLPTELQEKIYEAVIDAVRIAMEKTLVPLLEQGNAQRQTQIEKSDNIIKIEREQLGVQTASVYLNAKQYGRESDLGLTQEQLNHGIQNASTYFQTYANQSAMREAEFERDMDELNRSLV